MAAEVDRIVVDLVVLDGPELFASQRRAGRVDSETERLGGQVLPVLVDQSNLPRIIWWRRRRHRPATRQLTVHRHAVRHDVTGRICSSWVSWNKKTDGSANSMCYNVLYKDVATSLFSRGITHKQSIFVKSDKTTGKLFRKINLNVDKQRSLQLEASGLQHGYSCKARRRDICRHRTMMLIAKKRFAAVTTERCDGGSEQLFHFLNRQSTRLRQALSAFASF